MLQEDKIPIIVGVTGHRNIVDEDKLNIKALVIESLKEIQSLCKAKRKGGKDTPVIMLNAFAQGADMLCAEAAFELGVPVYAVLPCKKEKYINSFDNEADKAKLESYLARTERQFVAPDTEKNKAWIKKSTVDIDDDSYEYRQLGIYMAEHSHILIALWDGKPPKVQYGCGTVEVIKFALEHKFLDKDKLFKPGMINDSAVIWIKSRRQGDGAEADVCKKWLISNLNGDDKKSGDYLIIDEAPKFLKDIISKTVAYNDEKVDIPQDTIKLWSDVEKLDEYHKNLRQHYIKADQLSFAENQRKYNLFILLLAIIGTVVAFTFLIYDDASLPFMIFPCTVAVVLVLWLVFYGNRKGYHRYYIKYRALAEALRIQFYMSICLKENPVVTNVCEFYAWSQKVEMVWIDKAIQALAVTGNTEKIKIAATETIDVWIGNNEKPTGQLQYHNKKKTVNGQKAIKFAKLSKITQIATIVIYFSILLMEIIAYILRGFDISWFWEGNIVAHVTWRNFAAIAIGTITAFSLLISSYWGKLSYDRKASDNENMSKFYASARERWNEVKSHPAEIEKFVKEIAREEIVENGIWRSYVNENRLEINL